MDKMEKYFKNACRIHTHFSCARYIIAVHRNDGGEKATRHVELSEFYAEAVGKGKSDLWKRIHDNTQELTNNLDVHCGFSYEDHLADKSNEWTEKFFDKFHEIAMNTAEL